LIRAFRANPRHDASAEGAFRSLPGGLSEMIRALVAAMPAGSIRLATAVERIRPDPDSHGYRVEISSGEMLAVSNVVLATPAYVTSRVISELNPRLARMCDEIPYTSTATVVLAFPRHAVGHPLGGSGFVVPKVEGLSILAASWLSSKWPDRAPQDRVLMRAFAGGARDPDAIQRSDRELADLALSSLRPLLGISGPPLLTRVYRWPRASAQHEVGHLARVAGIERELAGHPGLFVTGSGFRGVGIPDCVADGRATAALVAERIEHVMLPDAARSR
jgi:oxygen-dependent protoporphyrinogen oxidase